ncbi:PAS domain S-box protein [Halobaculum sp. D14]|uniref:PAS domain S-box protein n=1 Tax=Halobaculum sp. D14 TaxID=3421642 RepID=UPI003EBAD687
MVALPTLPVLAACSFLAGAACLGIGPVLYRATRGHGSEAQLLVGGAAVVAALWATAHGFHLTATAPAAQLTWARIAVALGAPTATCWAVLVVTQTRPNWSLPAGAALLLAAEPAVTAAAALGFPRFVFAGYRGVDVAGTPVLVLVPGRWLGVHGVYTAALCLFAAALLVRGAVGANGRDRSRYALLFVAGAVPTVTEALWWLPLPGVFGVNHTPIALAVSAACLFAASRRYALFGEQSMARDAVFDQMRDGVVVVDGANRIVDTNAAARAAFDVDDADVGAPADEVLPDDAAALTHRGVDEDEPLTIPGDDGDDRVLEPQREPLPGGTDGSLLSFRDVTDRRRAERRYRAYVEYADDIVVVSDADGNLDYVSPAVERALGYARPDMEGDPLLQYVHPDDRRGVAEPFAQALDNPGERVEVTFRARHADGGWRTLEGVGVNRFDDPDVAGYLVTLRDTTTNDRYEQRLRVLTRVLRHDLRNELNVVLGYADVIVDEGDEQLSEYGDNIRRAAKRLATLGERVRGVDRTLSDTDHGGRPVDVGDVAEEVGARAEARFPDADVDVEVDDCTTGFADELLATATWNLVENAVQHHDGEEPAVRLRVRRTDDAVELRVADDGPGIPADDRDAVESGHETQLKHASGIGLWLVRWIINGVDGELTFEGNDPRGSVVVVRLRAADAAPTGDAAQMDPWAVSSPVPEQSDGGRDVWPDGDGDGNDDRNGDGGDDRVDDAR